MKYHLSRQAIKERCSLPTTWKKAVELYQNKKVFLTDGINTKEVTAVVIGTKAYDLSLSFGRLGDLVSFNCNCPGSREYPGACEHVTAALLQLMDEGDILMQVMDSALPWPFNDATLYPHLSNSVAETVVSEPVTEAYMETLNSKRLLKVFEKDRDQHIKTSIKMNFVLQPHLPSHEMMYSAALTFKIGVDHMYAIKDIEKFLDAINGNEPFGYGKNFTLDAVEHRMDERFLPVVNFLELLLKEQRHFHTKSVRKQFVYLTQVNLEKWLALSEQFNYVMTDRESGETITVIDGTPDVRFMVSEKSDRVHVGLGELKQFRRLGLNSKYLYDYKKANLYSVPLSIQRKLDMIFEIEKQYEHIDLPKEDFQEYINVIHPTLASVGKVRLTRELGEAIIDVPVENRLYLDYKNGSVAIRIMFAYGEVLYEWMKNRYEGLKEGEVILRNFDSEEAFLKYFELPIYKKFAFEVRITKEEDVYEFIKYQLPVLKQHARVFSTKDFRGKKVLPPKKLTQSVRLSSELDYLSFDLNIEDIESEELFGILEAYRKKQKYYLLQNGDYLSLEDYNLEHVDHIIDTFQVTKKDIGSSIELPITAAYYLDQVMETQGIERNKAFESLIDKLKVFKTEAVEVPKALDGVLRDYQKLGFEWLSTLAKLHMGGVLADDMGLGKTIQVLAFLKSQIDKGIKYPTLIVAPTSLVYNWAKEIEKFVPDIKFEIIDGEPNRREKLINTSKADVWITSYALIRRDVERFKKRRYFSVVLDEAQHIKNDRSIGAMAVKSLSAKNRFALTGTPIENHLGEFWSIFDFVLPGHLGSRYRFAEDYEKPIVTMGDKDKSEQLIKMIEPFMMRRIKKDVLSELPDKIESIQPIKMTEVQGRVYGAMIEDIRQDIRNGEYNNGRIKLLAGLTRLRQICSHPSSFLEDYEGGSGKFEALKELLSELKEGNHRVLIFSQFTSVLTLIKEELELDYFYLDGKTKAQDRSVLVDRFNEGEKDVFLISLKAGGTGLNLTGADTVIHFDPWWNPAVENQASDRAHRIGQKKTVQVIKFVTINTIEEKIIKLQNKKKDLIDQVIKPGETMLQHLSEDELKALFE